VLQALLLEDPGVVIILKVSIVHLHIRSCPEHDGSTHGKPNAIQAQRLEEFGVFLLEEVLQELWVS
jgi:hypothetical protein